MEQQIGTAQLVVDDNELCIAKKNIIANGDFSGKLNFWTTGSGSSAMIVNNGCQYLGNGNFYQSMKNITLGVQHIARVLVYSISGTVTARVGTTAGASDLGSKTLSVGWNNFVFTGSSVNFITIVGGSADSTCIITKIECRESINLTASGDFFLGDDLVLDDITCDTITSTGLIKTSGKIETTNTDPDSIKTDGGGQFGGNITAHNFSGTNTGDQTSIVGITGTKSQFNTAVTDGDILYVGDVTTNATHTGDVTGSTALTIANDAVTLAKMANLATAKLIGRTTAGTGDPEAVPIVSTLGNPGVDTNIPTEKAVRDAISASVTSVSAGNGMSFTTITETGSVTMGTPSDITPISTNETTSTSHSHEITGGTLCRAWVNFNGTGTVAIRASFNVSSITDSGVGYYTINFATAMPDTNYSVSGISTNGGNTATFRGISLWNGITSVNNVTIITMNGINDQSYDGDTVCAQVFR